MRKQLTAVLGLFTGLALCLAPQATALPTSADQLAGPARQAA